MTENVSKADSQNREIGISNMMGIFFLVFAIAVIVAVFFTETTKGKIVNLICGGLLLISAAVPFIKSWLIKKQAK